MFRNFRKFSAFAAEDIPVMSHVFTTWGDIAKVGSFVVITSQVFTALQLERHRAGIDKSLADLTDEFRSNQKKVENVERKVEGLANEVRSLSRKLDQALEKKS